MQEDIKKDAEIKNENIQVIKNMQSILLIFLNAFTIFMQGKRRFRKSSVHFYIRIDTQNKVGKKDDR